MEGRLVAGSAALDGQRGRHRCLHPLNFWPAKLERQTCDSRSSWYCLLGTQIAVSLANHARDLPDLAHAVKYAVVPDATKDNLTAAWKAWIEQAGVLSHLFCTLARSATVQCPSWLPSIYVFGAADVLF